MKRNHNLVSATPLLLLKKGKTSSSSRQQGFLGTPVEGLTGIAADTPDSDDRPQRAFPETTQRRLEGFCLTTPLSLSQQAAAEQQETPTLGKDQPAQHDDPEQQDEQQEQEDSNQPQQQQHHHHHPHHHHHHHMLPSHNKQQQQQPQHAGPAGLAATGGRTRHRLANISNLPPSPASAMLGAIAAAAAGDGGGGYGGTAAAAAAGCRSPAPPDSGGVQPMATGGTTGRSKQRRHHVAFHPDLSTQASQLAPASGSRTGFPSCAPTAHTAAAAAAGAAARTPYPSHSISLAASVGACTPYSSCGLADDEDCGFVLFTSQSYVRQSQPAISPSFAAGLSAAPEEEPNTTPSQDSREPRMSPSNGTTSHTTGSMSFDLPQPLASTAAAAAGAVGGGALCGALEHQQQAQQQRQLDQQEQQQQDDDAEFELQQQQMTGSQVTAPNAPPVRSAGGNGSATPADGLLGLLPVLEETTTPELEQIGIVPSQEGGSQQNLLLLLGSGAAAAAAAGGGSGSRALAAAGGGRGGARGGSGGAAAAAAGGGGSSGRGARGPGVVCEEVTAKQMLFPVFRPRTERKCVILVRHGESTYNKQDAHGKSWSDPKIFDAPLTQRGRQQAIAARERVSEMLRKHGHLGSTLWISSPLTRALETMTLAAPQVEALAAGQDAKGAPKVVVSSLIAEHCATSGDVGRPASQLRGKFPGLLPALDDLQEEWWFNPAPEDNPNCAVTGVFNKVESIDNMRRRVSEFASWLRHRPEHVVVAFGHSTFWKYFANSRTRLRNCEVLQMWW